MLKIYSVQGYIQPSYLNIYSVQCTWTYPVSKPKYVQFQCIMYRIISGLYTKTCITYSVQGHIRSSNLNMYSVQCTVYSEQCTGLYPASIPKHIQCAVLFPASIPKYLQCTVYRDIAGAGLNT